MGFFLRCRSLFVGKTASIPLFPAFFRLFLCPVEGVGFIVASVFGISILRHSSGEFAACCGDLA